MSDYFPTELMYKILLNLPVKPLLRFTTVCKSWRSIITSPDFVAEHLAQVKNQALLLLRRSDEEDNWEHYSLLNVTENGAFGINSSSQLEFPFISDDMFFRIVGCSDGLVCLLDDLFGYSMQPQPKPIILWNPSLRNHLVLPNPTINPTEPHYVILGYGVASHVHKVVRLVYPIEDRLPPQVEIFSLKTRSWRRLREADFGLPALLITLRQAFLNGIVHWIAFEPRDDNAYRGSILAFHIGDEVFSQLMFPDELTTAASANLDVFVIEESLGIVKYDGETNKSCDVWKMNDYAVKESWVKLYTIDLLEVIENVVGFWKSGEALLALKRLVSEKVVIYNSETKQIKDLGISGTSQSLFVDNYVESLLLLGGYSGDELEG